MTNAIASGRSNELRVVLGGEPQSLRGWIDDWDAQRLTICPWSAGRRRWVTYWTERQAGQLTAAR